MMGCNWQLILLCLCIRTVVIFTAFANLPIPQAFPDRWDGDRYYRAPCETVQAPPQWVNGYLFAQISGSYGSRSNPVGQRIDHLFDAISGIAAVDITPKHATFTGAYYPTKSYKIWNFYDREFNKSSVAWVPSFTTFNVTAQESWKSTVSTFMDTAPNVDFWKINNSIVAGTEQYDALMTFDLDTISNFRPYPFKESPGLAPLIPLEMPIHERVDPDTQTIWGSVSAANVTSIGTITFHQVIFTVDSSGVRRTEGIYDFPPFYASACQSNGSYTGDLKSMPRYMHSITSTKNYVILPLTSMLIKTCEMFVGTGKQRNPADKFVDMKDLFIFGYSDKVPLRFLAFDKRTKKFLPPVDADDDHFVCHQYNAYESPNNADQLIMDMLSYKYMAFDTLMVDRLMGNNGSYPISTYHFRFTLDLKTRTVTKRPLLPKHPVPAEFSQFNHKFEGKPYKYGYVVAYPFVTGSKILKIDMDTPSGEKNLAFTPKNRMVSLAEAFFAARPGGTDEDDGVLVCRGLDASINKTRIYVIDAKTMDQVGEFIAPTLIPFGLHERFYTKTELGIK